VKRYRGSGSSSTRGSSEAKCDHLLEDGLLQADAILA
jgi:hypothetical protein